MFSFDDKVFIKYVFYAYLQHQCIKYFSENVNQTYSMTTNTQPHYDKNQVIKIKKKNIAEEKL